MLNGSLRGVKQDRLVSLIIHGASQLAALLAEPLLLELVLLGIIQRH